jgi:Na+-transporting methylmalonyl-CoA/oxaloacetate decarboxylase beta subunit
MPLAIPSHRYNLFELRTADLIIILISTILLWLVVRRAVGDIISMQINFGVCWFFGVR